MSNSTSATDGSAAVPGYVVGESRSGDLIAIVACMAAFSTAVLALRLWTRIRIQGMPLGADDWTILASWLFSIAFTVNVCTRKYASDGQSSCGPWRD